MSACLLVLLVRGLMVFISWYLYHSLIPIPVVLMV